MKIWHLWSEEHLNKKEEIGIIEQILEDGTAHSKLKGAKGELAKTTYVVEPAKEMKMLW